MNTLSDELLSNSIKDLIAERAQKTPKGVYLIDPDTGEQVTYRQLQSQIDNIVFALMQKGFEPGDRIAFALENGINTAVAVLALYCGGYLATAVNLVAGPDTIGYVLEHSKSRLVLIDAQTRDLIEQATAELAQKPELESMHKLLKSKADNYQHPIPVTANDDGLLMYTSGTTGRPKGVVLTHKNLLAGGSNCAIAHKLISNDRALCVLPLYHINGMCVTLLGPLVSGGSVVVPNKFSVRRFWNIIADHSATWFSVVPTQISYLLHDNPDHFASVEKLLKLRFGRSASAPLSPDVHRAFEKRFGVPIIETMGLTETAAQILSNPLPPAPRKTGSPGIAFGNDIKIADNNHVECPANTEGEILVRGANVMRCYLDNQQATQQAITRDNWLRTGDLGRMDHDGYVYVTGRLKELIIKGGENIAPREIDDALYSHSAVIEAAAFACGCETYGERVEAGVVLKEACGVTEADLINLCIAKLGRFKSPDKIHILDDLPKGPSGKIQRNKIREMING